jgi:predicted RNase H-like HicB family nuclease
MGGYKWKYPAFIYREEEGEFGVYFPTLFGEDGWDYPLGSGITKSKAIKEAKKELAYTIAGLIYDKDPVPEPGVILKEQLSTGMELIEIETCFDDYKDEIEENFRTRHWHIDYWTKCMEYAPLAFKMKKEHGISIFQTI